MNNYKYLIWSGTAVLVILAVFLLVSSNRVWNTATTTNTVSFSGEGRVVAKPDIAIVSAAVITQATYSKNAQDQNSKKSNTVTDFLKKQGIQDKDIKTIDYSINPQYKFPPYGVPTPPNIIGYQVSQIYEIKVRDLTNIGRILDGLVIAGANSVNNLGLQIENTDTLKAEARKKAIADAKKKANELQNQVGISLGKIVNFSENTGGYSRLYVLEAKSANQDGGSGPSIPTGENEITVNVTITYQIK